LHYHWLRHSQTPFQLTYFALPPLPLASHCRQLLAKHWYFHFRHFIFSH
jgi:hypothetical protein